MKSNFLSTAACFQAGTRRICSRSDWVVVHWFLRQSALYKSDRGQTWYSRLARWRMQGKPRMCCLLPLHVILNVFGLIALTRWQQSCARTFWYRFRLVSKNMTKTVTGRMVYQTITNVCHCPIVPSQLYFLSFYVLSVLHGWGWHPNLPAECWLFYRKQWCTMICVVGGVADAKRLRSELVSKALRKACQKSTFR